jgi:hypothetical protein
MAFCVFLSGSFCMCLSATVLHVIVINMYVLTLYTDRHVCTEVYILINMYVPTSFTYDGAIAKGNVHSIILVIVSSLTM